MQLIPILKQNSFLSSEFVGVAFLLGTLAYYHENPWLLGGLVWSYMVSRAYAKRAYGLKSRGPLTTELWLSSALSLLLLLLGTQRHVLMLLLVITQGLYCLCRAAAKARPESNAILVR